MKRIYLILGILAAVAVGAAVSLLGEWAKLVVGLFTLYALPFFIAEEMYDVIEKRIAPWVNEKGHLLIAVIIGIAFLVAWPFVVKSMTTANFLFVRDTLLYARPLDLTPSWFGLPTYAIRYGVVAFLTSIGGYLFEMGVLQLTRKLAHRGR